MEKEEQLHIYRHSMAHVLAKAITELYPNVKLTIGPAIDNGFYYDIDSDKAITPDDFKTIEKKMDEIIRHNEKFQKKKHLNYLKVIRIRWKLLTNFQIMK